MAVILQADHPSAKDPIAKLIRPVMPIGREIYSVRGGYLACLDYPYCLAGLFESEVAATAAQAKATLKGKRNER
jgi:hypothetical protein